MRPSLTLGFYNASDCENMHVAKLVHNVDLGSKRQSGPLRAALRNPAMCTQVLPARQAVVHCSDYTTGACSRPASVHIGDGVHNVGVGVEASVGGVAGGLARSGGVRVGIKPCPRHTERLRLSETGDSRGP